MRDDYPHRLTADAQTPGGRNGEIQDIEDAFAGAAKVSRAFR